MTLCKYLIRKYVFVSLLSSLILSNIVKASDEDFTRFHKQPLSTFVHEELEATLQLLKIFENKIKDFVLKYKIYENPRKELALAISVFKIFSVFSEKIDKIIQKALDIEFRFDRDEIYYRELLNHDAAYLIDLADDLWSEAVWNQFIIFLETSAPWFSEEITACDLSLREIDKQINNNYLSLLSTEENSSFEDIAYDVHSVSFHPDHDSNKNYTEEDVIIALFAKLVRVSEYRVLQYMISSQDTERMLEDVYQKCLWHLEEDLPDFVYLGWLISFPNSLRKSKKHRPSFQVYYSWMNVFASNFHQFLRQRSISSSSYGQFFTNQQVKKKEKDKEEDTSKGKEEDKEEDESETLKRKFPSEGGESSESASARKRLRTAEEQDEERLTLNERQIIEELIVDAHAREDMPNLKYAERHLSAFAFMFLLSHFIPRHPQ